MLYNACQWHHRPPEGGQAEVRNHSVLNLSLTLSSGRGDGQEIEAVVNILCGQNTGWCFAEEEQNITRHTAATTCITSLKLIFKLVILCSSYVVSILKLVDMKKFRTEIPYMRCLQCSCVLKISERQIQSFNVGSRWLMNLKDFICHKIAAIPEARAKQEMQNFSVRIQEYITW